MDRSEALRIAVVGLEFGAGFVGPFVRHPRVESVGLCDLDANKTARVAAQWGCRRTYRDLDEILACDDYDAVALFTPIPQHAPQSLAVLSAGKHCACAVPMATALEDLRAVVEAGDRAGRNYMMLETALYTPEFCYVEELLRSGEMGQIQFLQGRFHMNLENHPPYWHGLPPLLYCTHPLAPMLALAETSAASVCALGSGRMRSELTRASGNPWPVEMAIFRLRDSDIAAQVTSVHYETALQTKETFDVFCDRHSFTWANYRDEKHAMVRLGEVRPGGAKHAPMAVSKVEVPGTHFRLPAELRSFGRRGSQAMLVHEFVSSIVEGRPARIDARTAANYTAPGVCGHASARQEGERIDIPHFG